MNVLLLTTPASTWSITSGQDLLLLSLSLFLLVGMVLVGGFAVYLLAVLRRSLSPPPPIDTRPGWQKLAGLHNLSQEKDLMMEHTYDGIAELDNPTPPWFMALFYGTIGFGLVYLLVFHVFGAGDLQTAEYTREVALADAAREAYIRKVAGSINENTVVQVADAKSLDAGKALFAQYCVACHGAQAQGGVGPNLTDAYWLHGGSMKAVFHTITEGVPEKGMLSWKKQLNPLQVQQVASFILSLQGSNPPGAKAPQGTPEKPVAAPSTQTVAQR